MFIIILNIVQLFSSNKFMLGLLVILFACVLRAALVLP